MFRLWYFYHDLITHTERVYDPRGLAQTLKDAPLVRGEFIIYEA